MTARRDNAVEREAFAVGPPAARDINDRREHPVGARMTTEGRKYGKLPSVTTVLNVINKPGLPWGAAKETALFAVHHQDEWTSLSPDDAVERLRKHHKGVWTAKAKRGSAVHDMAKSWAHGAAVDAPVEMVGFLDALDHFYDDHGPVWTQIERTVIHQDADEGYAGTLDAIAVLDDGDRWLLDIKTGADVWPEVALQLAAYRFAPEMAIYGPDGALVETEPMPEVDRCGVVHLAEDGAYRLVPVTAGRREHEAFLQARALWRWTTRDAKGVLGEPVQPVERVGAT